MKLSRFPKFYIAALLILLYLPILVVVFFSFNSSKLFFWEGFSLTWYEQLFLDGAIGSAFFNSLKLALLSCLGAVIIGTMAALSMTSRKLKAMGLIENTLLMPIMIPEIILGMAYLAFFTFLKLPFGMTTLVLAHLSFCIPYIYLNVKAGLLGLNPSVLEAAMDLGAGRVRAFFDVTLPLIAPSILSGALLAFAMSMDDVIISFFATGAEVNTLPLLVYSMLKMGVTPKINALCTVLLGAVFVIVALSRLLSARKAS